MADRQSLSTEVMALAMQAGTARARLRDRLERLFGLHRAYRKTFFDKDGALLPHARIVLRDLVETAAIGMASREVDNGSLQVLEGQRRIVLHLFGRFNLPEGRIDQLERDLTQTEEPEE